MSGVACKPRLSPPVAKTHAGRRRATLAGVICARRTKRWPKGSRPYESHDDVSLAACSSCAVVIDWAPTAATHDRSTSNGASRCMDSSVADDLTERGRLQGVWACYDSPFLACQFSRVSAWCAARALACLSMTGDYVPTGFRGAGVNTRADKGHAFGLNLSPAVRDGLIAFLKTL